MHNQSVKAQSGLPSRASLIFRSTSAELLVNFIRYYIRFSIHSRYNLVPLRDTAAKGEQQ